MKNTISAKEINDLYKKVGLPGTQCAISHSVKRSINTGTMGNKLAKNLNSKIGNSQTL